MPIIVNLDVMLAKRKIRGKELATKIGITEQNLSLLRTGKVKGVRFSTLEKICQILECQPGDISRIYSKRIEPRWLTIKPYGVSKYSIRIVSIACFSLS